MFVTQSFKADKGGVNNLKCSLPNDQQGVVYHRVVVELWWDIMDCSSLCIQKSFDHS